MSRNPLYYVVALVSTAVAVYGLARHYDTYALNPARVAAGGIVGPLLAGLLFQYEDAGSIGRILAKAILAGVALAGTYYGLLVVSAYDSAALVSGEVPADILRRGAVLTSLAYLATLVLLNVRHVVFGASSGGTEPED